MGTVQCTAKVDTPTAPDSEHMNGRETGSRSLRAPIDHCWTQRSAPPLQSHRGLGDYREGQRILYSAGRQFETHKVPLFPGQSTEPTLGPLAPAAPASKAAIIPASQLRRPARTPPSATAHGWTMCALVDHQGMARIRRHPTKRYNATPTFIVPLDMAKGLSPRIRAMPLAHQVPTTARPQLPAPPPEWLKHEVATKLSSWEDCITHGARRRLQTAVSNAAHDSAILAQGPVPAHRQRARCGRNKAEVRIGPDELHPTVNKVLRMGFSVHLEQGSHPRIRELRALEPQDWGINAARLIEDAKQINWPDQELLFFLEFGFMDYSGNTPPISTFSPHQQKAVLNYPVFAEQTQKEIDEGWLGPAQSFPPSIPFQVRPGSLEPKSDGRTRLVWNASWPAPGSCDSAVKIGSQWHPIAPNASTVLPADLAFEWSAIETNNEAIEIMAEGAKATGAPLLGRTFDIAKWFRQLGMAKLDIWKGIVHVQGGFREDRRMQMGRRSSAHSAQRTTFLLTALLQRAAAEEHWGLHASSTPLSEMASKRRDALQAWLHSRNDGLTQHAQQEPATPGSTNGRQSLLYFSSFQDDITAVALGDQAAKDATAGVVRILQDKYGVLLSSKKEASRDFAPDFTAIGATYELADPTNITCRPRAAKLEKYQDMLDEIKRAGALISLHEMQRFAGLHAFMARFLPQGEFYCNSAYCCLRATPNTQADLRPISKNLIQDAEEVLRQLKGRALAPLTANPVFAHPGLQGFSADASGSADAQAEGWGIHVCGIMAHGKWPPAIKQALARNTMSISPLELLAAAIALSIAARYPDKMPASSQVILRSDSDSACTVANSMRADSAPMLEALRIFKEVQDDTGIMARLQHLPSEDNTISDSLSRGAIAAAVQEAGIVYDTEVVSPPEQVIQWCERLAHAALQAARHSTDTVGTQPKPAQM